MRAPRFLIILFCAGLLVAGCGGGEDIGGPATTGTITGQVTDAASGASLPGATITSQPATSTAQSDAQGNYSIANVAAGSYTVTAARAGYTNGSANAAVTGGETTTANLALTPLPTTGTIGGRVTDAVTGAGLVDATVTTEPVTSAVQTDAQGDYTIPNVAPASYAVTAARTGYTNGNANATVTAGQTSSANIALSPGPPANFDGTWSGATSQDSTISFTVQNNAITMLRIGFVVSCAYGFITFTFVPPIPITGNTFALTRSVQSPDLTIVFTVRGTFNTNTSASGSADIIPVNAPGCVVEQPTWTATRP